MNGGTVIKDPELYQHIIEEDKYRVWAERVKSFPLVGKYLANYCQRRMEIHGNECDRISRRFMR